MSRDALTGLASHDQARPPVEAGMRTLKVDGMEKIMPGMTDLKQVRSICIKATRRAP